jgi:type I restriction enzyme R subunit
MPRWCTTSPLSPASCWRKRVAPLMNSVDVRGQGDALRWDLLLLKAQKNLPSASPTNPTLQRGTVLRSGSADYRPISTPCAPSCRRLIKRIRSEGILEKPSFAELDAMRISHCAM